MQKSHRDRQARRVHIGASRTPIATEGLFDLFVAREIASRGPRFDNFHSSSVMSSSAPPLFQLAHETGDLLLVIGRPTQDPVEDPLYLVSCHAINITQCPSE
jgi:hypothetical protein